MNNFLKNRLIELSGILLIFISIFLLISIISYSPSDPNFIYATEGVDIKNIGGFYGSVISDFLLQSLGLISILTVLNFFYWGLKLTTQKKIDNFTTKIFFVLLYLVFGTATLNIFHNNSYWLIDNGNGGFVGQIIKNNIYYFNSLIENQYVIYFLILLSFIFFILSLNIKLDELRKIFTFPFLVILRILKFIKKNNKNNLN